MSRRGEQQLRALAACDEANRQTANKGKKYIHRVPVDEALDWELDNVTLAQALVDDAEITHNWVSLECSSHVEVIGDRFVVTLTVL